MPNELANEFLPENYEVPKSASNYLKLEKGENKFRVLGSAITGYEYWDNNNKPIRSKTLFAETPNARVENGKVTIKHFWAFLVYDYSSSSTKILELTQKSVMNSIKSFVTNKKWGNPIGYDLVITREGDGMETKYNTIAEPHSEIPTVDIPKVNLEALYTGDDPFKF